jgi:hypothetical protein
VAVNHCYKVGVRAAYTRWATAEVLRQMNVEGKTAGQAKLDLRASVLKPLLPGWLADGWEGVPTDEVISHAGPEEDCSENWQCLLICESQPTGMSLSPPSSAPSQVVRGWEGAGLLGAWDEELQAWAVELMEAGPAPPVLAQCLAVSSTSP